MSKIAFGYVENLVSDPWCDEWGSIDISELSELIAFGGLPRIEVDLYFTPKIFSEIKIRARD